MAEVASRDSNRIPVLLATSSATQVPTQVYVDASTHRLLVDAAITIDNLTVSQNISQIGGANITLGQAAMVSSIPIVIASNQTSIPVTGTFFQATQPVSIVSLPALSAGANVIGHVIVDSGAVTVNTISGFALETGGNLATLAGTVASSKVNVNISSGSIGNTSFASTIADGADVTLGAKADARSTATDVTAISIMSVLKEISFMAQTPASTPVTGTFWQTTQPVSIASLPALASGSNVIGHVIVDSGTITSVTAITNALPAGTNILGKVSQDTSPWVISGAVTEATLDAAIVSQEATTAGVKGITMFGAVTTAKPTYTTAKSDALSLDVNGLLRVSLADTPANTNKFLVTADAITFASPQHVIADSGTITTVTAVTAITNALPAGTNLIGNVGHGKTIKTATGSIASSGDNTIVNAVTSKRIKVIAYALFYASTTSNTLTFKDNTAGTGVWTVILQAPAANTVFGANLATNAPSFLFASLASDPLVLNLGQAVSVTYSITYFDDDAT